MYHLPHLEAALTEFVASGRSNFAMCLKMTQWAHAIDARRPGMRSITI